MGRQRELTPEERRDVKTFMRLMRESIGKTPAEMADMMNRTYQTIMNYETGTFFPPDLHEYLHELRYVVKKEIQLKRKHTKKVESCKKPIEVWVINWPLSDQITTRRTYR